MNCENWLKKGSLPDLPFGAGLVNQERMPAEVEKCVETLMDDPDFKPRDPKQTKEEAAWAVCVAAYKKKHGHAPDMEGSENPEGLQLGDEPGHGPTLIGAALTNIPFIVGMPEVSLDESGMMIIPLLKRSKWRHPQYGVLTFDDEFLGCLIRNYHNGVVKRKLIVNAGHEPDRGAYGLFKDVRREGDLLIVLAEPTSLGRQAVADRIYLYASAELTFDYRGREVQMSTADLEPYDEEVAGVRLAEQAKELYLKEAAMPENTEAAMPENTDTQKVITLEDLRAEYEAQVAQLTERLVAQEGHIARLKEQARQAKVDAIMAQARAYVDASGRAHAPVLLALCEKALRGEPLRDGMVKLSDGDPGDYLMGFISILLSEMPGSVPVVPVLEGTPSPVTTRHEDTELTEHQRELLNMVGLAKEGQK